MTPRLNAYLTLEREMRRLDEVDDPAAEAIRDALDPIWFLLDEDERDYLNRRRIVRGPVNCVRISLDETWFIDEPPLVDRTRTPPRVIASGDWEVT